MLMVCWVTLCNLKITFDVICWHDTVVGSLIFLTVRMECWTASNRVYFIVNVVRIEWMV